jgi:predicted RNase H-like nuclease (RuvC/YqgF family)
MAKLYDKDGNEIEAFTREEIDQTVQQERETAVAEANALREEEIANLMTEKEKLEDERLKLETTLEGMKDKDRNFGKVRGQVEAKDKEIEEMKTRLKAIEEGSNKKIEEIETARMREVRDEEIKALAGGDVELAKKLNFYYDSFTGTAKTKEEIKARMSNALLLATGGKVKASLTGEVISSGGGVQIPMSVQPQGKLSNPEVKDVAHKLGISDKDLAQAGLL